MNLVKLFVVVLVGKLLHIVAVQYHAQMVHQLVAQDTHINVQLLIQIKYVHLDNQLVLMLKELLL